MPFLFRGTSCASFLKHFTTAAQELFEDSLSTASAEKADQLRSLATDRDRQLQAGGSHLLPLQHFIHHDFAAGVDGNNSVDRSISA